MLASWSSGRPLPEAGLNWLLTHRGVGVFFGPKAIPQGFLTSGSVSIASPGMSETRLTWRNMRVSLPPLAFAAALAPPVVVAAMVTTSPSTATRAAVRRRCGRRRWIGCFCLMWFPLRPAREGGPRRIGPQPVTLRAVDAHVKVRRQIQPIWGVRRPSPDPDHAGVVRRQVAEGPARHLRPELHAHGMAPREAARRVLGHDEVGRPELPGRQQPADQRVDPVVRRVRYDAERVTGPAELADVHLDHRDPGAGELSTQLRRAARVQLHSQDPGPGPCQRDGQHSLAGAEVDDDVAGPDRGLGHEAFGPVRPERVPPPPGVPPRARCRPGRGHGAP